ncbi:MAG: ribosome-associated translation inhibitor RaiA [Eubacteriales bacterium]|mgnify:FL=1|nr:ribosome-associated translation inhibitor RaiA [bacterium]MDY2793376.1 ribosome-associated translation inhibitor RaiA [Eubacteriales bacterium]
MRITITGKNLTVTEDLKNRIEKKLGKMDRYFRQEVDATVRLTQEKNLRYIAEITITVGGIMLRAEETSDDIIKSADRAVDKIERQIRRHRTKLEKRLHEEVVIQAEETENSVEEESQELVRVKRFEMKPMTVEDAILQMDMLGHSFFLFQNSETGITSVVYRRNDGNIGMLEPTNI